MTDGQTIDQFIGDRVRVFREDRGLKRAELARRMDIAAPHLLNLEIGARAWTARMAELAAMALEVDVSLLFPRRAQPSARGVSKPQAAQERAAG